MTKKICLFLIVCLVFSFCALPIFALDEESVNTNSDGDSLAVNLLSSSDFYMELEKEGITAEDSDEYNICLLIEVMEDSSVDLTELQASNIIADNNEIDEAIFQHRNMVKNYYSEHNQHVAEELLLTECNYYVSYYAPYIEVIFDDIAEYAQYEEIIIDAVEQKQDIIVSLSNFAVLEQGFDNATINGSSSTTYPFDEVLVDIGVDNQGFTGAGIKVGVIESGYPNSTVNLKTGLYTFLGSKQTSHCVGVTSIIGGETGIAEDVHFYCLSRGSSLTKDFNTLINTYDVDIINMSHNLYICGYYTACDAYVDMLISNSGCTIAISAANTSYSPASLVCAPGCSLNAITVGSIDSDKDVSSFSCWVTTDTYLLKPDVVAPGGYISGIDNVSPFAGTSASTPMVTGVIALLMEEFPVLKTNPALVKSVLHLGAEYLPSQTSYYDQQAGFGLLNYQNMRLCLQNANYVNFNIPTTADAGNIVVSKNVTIPYLDGIAVNANSIVNSSMTTSGSATATPTYTDYSIKIYDISLSQYVASSSINSSVDYLVFTNNNPNHSSFRIDIVLNEDSASTESEAGSVAYQIICNTHSYGLYIYYNNKSHIKYCSCGAYLTEGHYIRQADIVDNRYVRCLGCRAQLDLFEDYANTIMSAITQVSINGSYVLPSGIVVLVDEDVQAYLDGTLVFYHPNNIPTTQ